MEKQKPYGKDSGCDAKSVLRNNELIIHGCLVRRPVCFHVLFIVSVFYFLPPPHLVKWYFLQGLAWQATMPWIAMKASCEKVKTWHGQIKKKKVKQKGWGLLNVTRQSRLWACEGEKTWRRWLVCWMSVLGSCLHFCNYSACVSVYSSPQYAR